MRVKTQWHRSGKPKSADETARALAPVLWRLADKSLKNLQSEDYAILDPQQAFSIIAEFLVFMTQIADRIAYETLDNDTRSVFITALALRTGEILEENILDSPNIAPDDYRQMFVRLLNRRAGDYAAFRYTSEGPDFSFKRYLGLQIREVMGDRDKAWIIDQIMEIETPEMVETIQKGVRGLLDASASINH
ncbi:MAG TPA: hypothetical protein DEP05_09240 [Betaproteobacteria bacterium]|nr:hypothetical protein [Betaproteobacteria bacterium]